MPPPTGRDGLTHVVLNQSLPDPTGPIVVAAGEFYEQADFGYYLVTRPGNAPIGDTVWYDYDADGIQDDNEPGIPGVTVRYWKQRCALYHGHGQCEREVCDCGAGGADG